MLKIISGGQTGVDRGALDAALEVGAKCGGWCPAGRLAEDRIIPERYPVTEMPTSEFSARTRRNVEETDATLIITRGEPIGGTRETLEFCREMGKPFLVIDCAELALEEAIDRAVDFASRLAFSRRDPSTSLGMTLNVAGPRASQWLAGREVAHQVVAAVLRRVGGHPSGLEYSS